MLFGLLGRNISYSFSKKFFTQKFNTEKLNHKFENIDLHKIDGLVDYLNDNIEKLQGFSVTIPYKEEIFKYLYEVDDEAKEIGAVNCVKIINKSYLKGFNTDTYGFENALKPLLKKHNEKALILGTGGASKAVVFSLKKLKIDYKLVSRTPNNDQYSYEELTKDIINNYTLIINTTPLGTKGKFEDKCANIPYKHLTKKHYLFDLNYNPDITLFLKKGKEKGTTIKNGLEMLELQAEKAWEIWNE